MAAVTYRLEHIMEMARQGKKIGGEVDLRKVPMKITVHPEAEIAEEQQGYLYTGEYRFRVDGDVITVSKAYIHTFATDSVEVAKANRNIVNARLKEGYRRLKDAGIPLDEKYFDESRVF